MDSSTVLKLILKLLLVIICISFDNGETDSGRLLCGFTKYDPKTHECHNRVITERTKTLVCGDNLEIYNPETHLCDNNVIKRVESKTTPATSTLRTSLSNGIDLSQNGINSPLPCSQNDLLNCSGNVYCGNSRDYKCCGFETYHPRTQTCCLETSAKYSIYDNKPERNHICCGVYVYPRKHSAVPCQHSSRNDVFLTGKLWSLSQKILDSVICNEHVIFAYHLKITDEHTEEDGRYLTATMTQFKWQTRMLTNRRYFKRVKTSFEIRIPLDDNNPRRLRRRGFLILSNYQYLNDPVFYLRYGDYVFKAQKKNRVFTKKLRKIQMVCSKI